MLERLQFYIDGQWVDPVTPKTEDVINPATEEAFARISMGSKADVDKAVAAAKKAFPSFSRTTPKERIELLQEIMAAYQKHLDEIAEAITPRWARRCGSPRPRRRRPRSAISARPSQALNDFEFEVARGKNLIAL